MTLTASNLDNIYMNKALTGSANKTGIDQKYVDQATAQYDPAYNAKITALKNSLAQNQLTLDQSKTGINSNYDTQVANQNLQTKKNQNTFSNTMLGRGIANSSIAGTGIAEQGQIGARQVGLINSARTSALNDVESQKSLLAQNMNNTLGQMAGDRMNEINSLARQLADVQFEKDIKNRQMTLSEQAQAYQKAYQDAQLALQRQAQEADSSYKNKSLSLQERAQQADLAYKYSALAAQRAQQGSDDAYKYAALQYQKDKDAQAQKNALAQQLFGVDLLDKTSSDKASLVKSIEGIYGASDMTKSLLDKYTNNQYTGGMGWTPKKPEETSSSGGWLNSLYNLIGSGTQKTIPNASIPSYKGYWNY